MNHNISLSNTQLDRLLKNADSAGISPSMLVSQMLDDAFGGMDVGRHSDASVKTIKNQMRSLESILKK